MATSDFKLPESSPPARVAAPPKRPATVAGMKVPLIIVCSLIALGAGAAGGVGSMLAFGYHWDKQPNNNPPPGPGGPNMPGGPGGPNMPGGPGGPGGFRPPSPKTMLANLVVKIDQLTAKPLQLKLDDDQKKKIQEQIDGLEKLEELDDAAAGQKMAALIEVLKDQKDTLEAAGYRWPGEVGGGPFEGGGPGGGRPGGEAPKNPFNDEKSPAYEHLKSLQNQLAKTELK
jgi:hypothetical protein